MISTDEVIKLYELNLRKDKIISVLKEELKKKEKKKKNVNENERK